VASITSQMYVNQTNKDMADTMARLSSGKRINTAADDAAGVAISSRLQAEVRGTNQAIRNASDAQALIDTAEGAQLEIVNLLQRMRELAVQAANDTNSSDDRASLTDEMTALTAEIDRIANVTSWAGEELLDGATPSSATTDADSASFTFHVGARNNAADSITATIAATGSTALGIAGTGNFAEAMTNVTTVAATAAKMTVTQGAGTIAISGAADAETYSVKINGTTVNITTAFAGDQYEDSDIGVAQQLADEIEAAGIAGVVVTGQGTATLTVKIGQSLDISSATNAQTAIGTIDSALRIVNNNRADLGAVSNRLDSTIANLSNIAINLEDGRSRIEDADFAAESANLAKQQIMLQAGTAMLAQANASQQNVLSLLG